MNSAFFSCGESVSSSGRARPDLLVDLHKGAAEFLMLTKLSDFTLRFTHGSRVGRASLMVLLYTLYVKRNVGP